MFKINTLIASLGLILATVSFITGLQAVKKDKMAAMMVSMHRFNGYMTCFIYIIVATMSLNGAGGLRLWSVIGWAAGMGLIIAKIMIVRNEKLYKYGSRVGLILFLSWLFIIYKHIVA